jgi:peptidyl-prolyl cis-trans isomerase D
MLKQMRSNTKTILWIILIGFLLMIVIEWGIGGLTGVFGPKQGLIGKINGQDIALAQFYQLLEQSYQAKRDELKTDILDQSVRDQIKEQTWNTLVNEILIRQEMQKRHILVTNEEISGYIQNNPPDYIKKTPFFLNADSVFDIQKYQEFLNSPSAYENPENKRFILGLESETRSMLEKRELFRQILATAQMTDLEVENAYRDQHEKVKVKYLGVNAYDFSDSAVKVTDTEKKDYYAGHKDEFKQEERRSIEFVMVRKEMTPEDSQYVKQQIDKLAQRVKDGENFADLAKAYSEDPSSANGGDLGYVTKGAMVKEFEEATFALDSGKVSAPVKTIYGWHLIKRGGQKKHGDTLEVQASHILIKFKMSPHTTAGYRRTVDDFYSELAKSTMAAAKAKTRRSKNQQGGGGSIAVVVSDQDFRGAAQRHRLQVQESGPFIKSVYIPMIGYAKDLVNLFFRSEIGTVSEVYETSNGFYVGRLVTMAPAGTQSYTEAAYRIESRLRNEKKLAMARQLLEQIAPQARSNAAWETMPFDRKVTYKETDFFSREDFVPGIGTKNEFVAGAFALEKPGQVGGVIATDRGCFIIQLMEKIPADQSAFAGERQKLKEQLLQTKQNKIYVNWFTRLRQQAKITDYRDLYNQ